jgi:tungstate transport system ATP-binding protein
MRDMARDFRNAEARPAFGTGGATLIEGRGLVFERARTLLIDEMEVRIAAGCRTVVLGTNGAGKSLLLRLLHGLLAPDAGSVHWYGTFGSRGNPAQAMVFQRPVMLRRSVRANLKFALSTRGIRGRAASERIERALVEADLADRAHQPARLLSGGEQQRLALARALATEPELLFLDEPTTSLDPAATFAIEKLICEAHARGVTVVMVTHDAGQARRLGDELLFLHRGRIVEEGPAAERLAAPRSDPMRAWVEGRLYLEPVR